MLLLHRLRRLRQMIIRELSRLQTNPIRKRISHHSNHVKNHEKGLQCGRLRLFDFKREEK